MMRMMLVMVAVRTLAARKRQVTPTSCSFDLTTAFPSMARYLVRMVIMVMRTRHLSMMSTAMKRVSWRRRNWTCTSTIQSTSTPRIWDQEGH